MYWDLEIDRSNILWINQLIITKKELKKNYLRKRVMRKG